LMYSFRLHCVPAVDPATMRSEYQEYFLGGKGGRCTGLKNLQTSCAECLEIWEPQPPWTLRACPGLYRDCYSFVLSFVLSVCNQRRIIGEGCPINVFGLLREENVTASVV
jgi:hypothetical protein